jgi:hypothetical protein
MAASSTPTAVAVSLCGIWCGTAAPFATCRGVSAGLSNTGDVADAEVFVAGVAAGVAMASSWPLAVVVPGGLCGVAVAMGVAPPALPAGRPPNVHVHSCAAASSGGGGACILAWERSITLSAVLSIKASSVGSSGSFLRQPLLLHLRRLRQPWQVHTSATSWTPSNGLNGARVLLAPEPICGRGPAVAACVVKLRRPRSCFAAERGRSQEQEQEPIQNAELKVQSPTAECAGLKIEFTIE